MSDFERLEARVAMLQKRLAVVEGAQAARLASGADDLRAQQIAGELGFDVEVVVSVAKFHGGQNGAKRALVKRLAGLGWKCSRIARTCRLCERTVERWLSRQGEG